MRPLTEPQARRCEEAKGERCRCRCAGRLHGAQRAMEFLAADDPHNFSARDRGATSGSNVGLTDQTTPDLNDTRSRSQVSLPARDAACRSLVNDGRVIAFHHAPDCDCPSAFGLRKVPSVAPCVGRDIKRLSRSEAAKQPSEQRSEGQRFLLAGAKQRE